MSRNGVARFVESVLLIVGLLLVDYYIWQKTATSLYQGYESWAFDRELQGQAPSIRGFVFAELHLNDATLKERAPDENPAILQAPAAPAQHQLADNELIGRLEIPRVGVSGIVREGTDSSTLERAVGHIASTPLPWQAGNVAVAAHRDSFFRGLSRIRQNDLITFDTLQGHFEYQVESTRIVSPKNVSVLAASSDPELTLITCYPFYYVGSAPERFVVLARRIGAATDVPAAAQAALRAQPQHTRKKRAI
jgi:sortase A